MFVRRQLACSFCGKSAAEVSKLVAGPRVFICDTCIATAHRIISTPDAGGTATSRRKPSLWTRLFDWQRRMSDSEMSAIT